MILCDYLGYLSWGVWMDVVDEVVGQLFNLIIGVMSGVVDVDDVFVWWDGMVVEYIWVLCDFVVVWLQLDCLLYYYFG